MGLSGSGKSTLVRMFNRLIEPTSGQILLDGRDMVSMSKNNLVQVLRHEMCMVFQSFALMPHLRVLDNAAFGLDLAGVPRAEREKRAQEALDQVGLGQWGGSYPSELSGGMQQRVGLARALAVDPAVMLMDEAFSALDPLIRTEMQDELLKLQEMHQRTVVFISHDLDEAMRIGDRIAIMEGGKIVQVGTPEEILKNPANDYVHAFFRGVDPTNVYRAGDISNHKQTTIIRHRSEGPRAALERLIDQDRNYGYVLNPEHRFQGIVSVDSLKAVIKKDSVDGRLVDAFLEGVTTVLPDSSLQEVIPHLTGNPWPVPVVDDSGVYQGSISRNIFLETLYRSDLDEEQE